MMSFHGLTHGIHACDNSGMEQRFELTQTFTLSERMIQSFRILQMNISDLHDYLETVSMDNPVIETEYAEGFRGYSRAHEEISEDLYVSDEGDTLAEYLEGQWTDPLSAKEKMIFRYLLNSLDERGYDTEPVQVTAAVLNVSKESVRDILSRIQKLEPAGVGASDLKDCLLLQAKRIYPDTKLDRLIEDCLEYAAGRDYEAIAGKLDISEEEAEDLCETLRTLNPFPGNGFRSPHHAAAIIPDIIIHETAGLLKPALNEKYEVRMEISSHYRSMLETADAETRAYLEKKIRQAEWIRSALQRRNETLLAIASYICSVQEAYLRDENVSLQPMRMNGAASYAGVHPSTVTRAVRDKYLECPRGIFPIRSFFTSGIKGIWSKDSIVSQIENIIVNEDPEDPLSDQRICTLLSHAGITVARRTVAKYRAMLGFKNSEARRRS